MFTYQNGCEPLNNTFTPTERKGINPSLLTYGWYVNANSISNSNSSVPYLFPTQGQYQVTLSITNVQGKKQCNGTITQTLMFIQNQVLCLTLTHCIKLQLHYQSSKLLIHQVLVKIHL
jgi:hypothetical protein